MSLDNVFSSVLSADGFTLGQFLLCTAVSLVLGLAVALLFMYRNQSSHSFMIALALLPAVVQTVIMLVNGNLGMGVAVAGAFSLVRFRSAPGTAKEITALFMTMAIGLATGTGYLWLAVLFTATVGGVFLLLTACRFGAQRQQPQILKITVPESLDYTDLYDDLLEQYTKESELVHISTSNMGSLYELTYNVSLAPGVNTREMIDRLRTRNGNLKISLGHSPSGKEEL